MTKRLLVLGLTLVALTAFASQSQAFGCRQRTSGCGGGCGGCGTTVSGCGPVAVAPAPVQYVDRTVTTYKTEWVEKTVQVPVRKMVTKTVNEPCTYDVQIPVVTQRTIQQTYCEQVMVDVPYTYTEM